MIDIDFKSFSPRSFERFAQALAMHVLGNGIMIFGDGPDGAREAAYEGTLEYPSSTDKWTGYTVMQAKFLQVPKAPHEDADWLVEQLNAELAKYDKPGSDIRKPEFYILVTNARLSPMPKSKRGAGGIAKIDEVFASHRARLGLKGWSVWHLDQIATMLAGADALRRSYAAWLTSSDVIARLLEGLEDSAQSVGQTMYRYLARELRSHQALRLQQAGHGGDARTMIEDVFSDLPFRTFGQDGEKTTDALLLSHLLDRSRDKLDRESVAAQDIEKAGRPERVLLLGGPGQGKSTVTQFLAQIFRANMLALDDPNPVSAEVRAIVDGTLAKAAAMGLPAELPKRFPLRVDLPGFADRLSKVGDVGTDNTLVGFLAAQITIIAGSAISDEDVRKWLRNYPNVLILDGLDEVPATANRNEVIRAINEFWDDVTSADTLMLVTTRPQGYNDDLDPKYYTKLEMTPLQPAQAIACAEKLAGDRIVDPIQRDRVLTRLRDASGSPTTARLMISPLQVAIMLALIDQRGDAPTDRWSLFDKYFAVVLEREQGKTGPVGQAMRHWARQIIAVHHKAGFLLHVEAETQGNSEAYLNKTEFTGLIRGQLADEGFEHDELDVTTNQLVSVSTERLVLLVQREEDRFSFEVRSLQEFMAAAHLMTGREAIVQKRLAIVANRTHWLHVFQIAASKCFAIPDAEQYRDTIITLCNNLNANGEAADRLLRSGSRLALSLLDDGLAYDAPKYRRLLYFLALELIEAGPTTLPQSLCDHTDREPARTVEKLRPYFASTLEPWVRGAWRLVLWCAARQQPWAEAMLDQIWPTEPGRMADPLRRRIDAPLHTALFAKLRDTIAASTPADVRKAMVDSADEGSRGWRPYVQKGLPALNFLHGNHTDELRASVKLDDGSVALSLRFSPLQPLQWQVQGYDDLPDSAGWTPLRRLRTFHMEPSANALADLLEDAMLEGWLELFREIRINLPWPMATLLTHCETEAECEQTIAAIRAGSFGDVADWVKAEDRWREEGVNAADLELSADGVFFDDRVADIGFPWAGLSLTHGENEPHQWVDQLIKIMVAARGHPRRWLGAMIQFVVSLYPPATPLTSKMILEILSTEPGKLGPRIDPAIFTALPPDEFADPKILDRIAELGLDEQFYLMSDRPWDPVLISALQNELTERPEMLVLLAIVAAEDDRRDHLSLFALDQMRSTLSHPVPIISGCAGVILLVAEAGDQAVVEKIFRSAGSDSTEFPLILLHKYLENRFVSDRAKMFISDLIARVINADPAIACQMFMNSIQTISSARISALQESQCWLQLELGGSLLALMQSRRDKPLK